MYLIVCWAVLHIARIFQRCIDYVDIARRSSARGRQTRVGEKQAILKQNASISRKL